MNSSHSQLDGLLIHSSAALLACFAAGSPRGMTRLCFLGKGNYSPVAAAASSAQRQADAPPMGASEGKQLGF